MSTPNTITIAGNLTKDPELRRTSSEIPFTRLRIAVNRRRPGKEGGTWEDVRDGFFNVTCWREMARHAQASLRKGDRVIVTGRLSHREFETTVEGTAGTTETRHVTEIEADEVGPSLRWDDWSRVVTRPLTEESVADDAPSATEDPTVDTDDDDRIVIAAA